MTALASTESPSRAATVQKVVSKGGIEAWLVEDYAVPLSPSNSPSRAARRRIRSASPAPPRFSPASSTKGPAPMIAEAFHRALDEDAIEISFSADRDILSGRMQTLARNSARAFDLLRLAVNEARLDAEPFERVVSQIAASLKREANDPDLCRQPHLPRPGLSRPSLWPARARRSRDPADADARQSHGHARRDFRARQPEDRRRRRDRRGDARRPSRRRLRPAARKGRSRAGRARALFRRRARAMSSTIDVPQSTIRFGRQGHRPQGPGFHRGDGRQSYPRRRHLLGAPVSRGAREARPRLFGLFAARRPTITPPCCPAAPRPRTSAPPNRWRSSKARSRASANIGPTEDELDKAKKYLIGSYALRFDTSTKIASQLVHLQTEGFGVEYLDERNKLIAAVTMEDAKRAAKRLFGDGKLLVTVAGQPEGM